MSLTSLLRRRLPRRVRPHTILGGRLRGARIVTSWHDYPAGIVGRTEAPLLSWLDAHVTPGTTWLDVGAHYGYTAIALGKLVGPRGRVFAFEPILPTAVCLTQTCSLNGLHQITVIAQALGCPDSVELLTRPTVRGMADSTQSPSACTEVAQISVVRFDWLWSQINQENPRIDGVKIDVQGMEIHVLRGMRTVLTEQRPRLVVEIHDGVDQDELLREVASCGYDPHPVPIEHATTGHSAAMIPNTSYAFFPSAAATFPSAASTFPSAASTFPSAPSTRSIH